MSFDNQRAAELLAICNDIGEAAYLDSQIAARLLEILRQLPSSSMSLNRLASRYGIGLEDHMTGAKLQSHLRCAQSAVLYLLKCLWKNLLR